MQFNISRQPLVPAFITLAALAVAAGFSMGLHSGLPLVATTDTLVIELPGTLLTQFQGAFPVWSKLVAALLILFAGMCTGRMTVRYNLYTVSTCMAIPLYAIVACGLPSGSSYLSAFAASALLALTLKNYGAAFCNGYGFDAIFRASAYLGLLVLVLPAALPLLLLLPLAVLLFRRTLREAIVATVGLVLPTALFCYINWGAGGDFTSPLTHLGSAFITGTPLGLLYQLPVLIFILFLGLILLSLFAVLLFLADRYNAGTKARLVLIFNIGILFLTVAQLCGPAASPELFPLLAIPMAVLLPVLFVRIHHSIALPIYLILLAAAFYAAILQ